MQDSRRRPFRPLDAALYLVGVAGLAMAITLVFLGMRSVMGVGGSCAEGGPYVIGRPCPDGVTPAMLLGSFGGLGAAGLAAWKGSSLGGGFGRVVGLAWPALFGSLGWNFLEFGLRPSPESTGPDIGWLICGVAFEAMALPVLVGMVILLRDLLRGATRELAGPLRTDAVDPVKRARAMADLDHVLRAGLAARTTPPAPAADARTALPNLATLIAEASSGALAPPRPVTAAPPTGQPDDSPADEAVDLVGALERLAALHRSGALTEEEFAQAKARIIEGPDR